MKKLFVLFTTILILTNYGYAGDGASGGGANGIAVIAGILDEMGQTGDVDVISHDSHVGVKSTSETEFVSEYDQHFLDVSIGCVITFYTRSGLILDESNIASIAVKVTKEDRLLREEGKEIDFKIKNIVGIILLSGETIMADDLTAADFQILE